VTVASSPSAPPAARSLPVHPILFAIYLVLFLYAQNLGEVELGEVLPVLGLAIGGSALALLVTKLVWRDLRRGAIVVSALVIVFFAYGHVANALVDLRVPGFAQQVGWVLFVIAAALVAWRIRGRLEPVTKALDAVALILIVVSLVTIVPHEIERATGGATPESPLPIVAGAAQAGPKRDIWYLIFDRYASNDQLQAAYGIDGTLQDFLEAHGFFVGRDSHANYVKTSLSLASSLNLTYLDDLAAKMGPDSDDHGPVFQMMKDHVLGRFLKSQGYDFVQVGSPYGPTNVNPYADENPRLDSTSDFAGAIYDTSVIPAFARRVGLVKATPTRERYYRTAQFQWETLDGLVDHPGPKLVFAHFLLPHPPYVFNADGSFHAEEDGRDVAPNYERQLRYTDTQIKALVTKLQALPEDRRPIIVLQADEGPYPQRYNADTVHFDWSGATQDELHMKYGILNGYDLPGLTGDSGLYPSITPVNSFRLILNKYFGTDTPLLPDREYTSKGKFRPYDLTDVTERLAQP
jgi:Sulfatase